MALLKKLDKLPDETEDHFWVDYIELLCLVHPDGMMSINDVIDRVRERGDIEAEVSEIEEDFEERRDAGPYGLSTAEINDEWSAKVETWFEHLAYRSHIFDSYYPFTVSEDHSMLMKKERMTMRRRLYISLLLSSCLRNISSGKRSKLTGTFEMISREALSYSFSDFSEVHIFGTAKSIRGRYRGNIRTKIKKLKRDLREHFHPQFNIETLSKHSVGDKGLDIVAWAPMADEENCMITIFGQCACTPRWEEKQGSSSPEKWGQIFSFKTPPINVIFIPYCFRSPDGRWYDASKIRAVIYDRVRIISVLDSVKTINFRDLESAPIVDEALRSVESLF